MFVWAALVEVEPRRLAGELGAFAVGDGLVEVDSICHTHVGHGSNLQVHSAVVDLGNFFICECAGRYYVIHDMCVVDALIGGDVSVIEFDCGFYPG